MATTQTNQPTGMSLSSLRSEVPFLVSPASMDSIWSAEAFSALISSIFCGISLVFCYTLYPMSLYCIFIHRCQKPGLI